MGELRKHFIGMLAVAAVNMGCAASFTGFGWTARQTEIALVKEGDSMVDVERKIGKPHELVSDEMTSEGRRKVIWGYRVFLASTHSVSGHLQAPTRDVVSLEKKSEVDFGTSDYLVVFIDGRVDTIIYR